MPMIRRLAYSAVSMASPPPADDAAPASTTANVGGTNGLSAAGCDAVQSRIPTANDPTWSSCARSWPSPPTVTTRKSRPPSAVRSMRTAPATDPSLTASTAASRSSMRSNRNVFCSACRCCPAAR